MTVVGKVFKTTGQKTLIAADIDVYTLKTKGFTNCSVTFSDGRTISPEQRKKAYALLKDIADYSGHYPEYLKEWFKYEYVKRTGENYFSLSDCSVTTARKYINILVDFCIKYGVQCDEPMTERTDDIDAYLYSCLYHRKCAVCGRDAEVHHVTGSKIGMGGNREDVHHLGRECIALCRVHHSEAHMWEKEFFKNNHIYGIKINERLCDKLNLRR